jgi:tetratricopeptide (TPR) repeat protein
VDLCDQALAIDLREPLIYFNLALALEGQDRASEAQQRYRQSLSLDPDLADAHCNLARLLETDGDHQGALRHYSACRRLESQGEPSA